MSVHLAQYQFGVRLVFAGFAIVPGKLLQGLVLLLGGIGVKGLETLAELVDIPEVGPAVARSVQKGSCHCTSRSVLETEPPFSIASAAGSKKTSVPTVSGPGPSGSAYHTAALSVSKASTTTSQVQMAHGFAVKDGVG